MRVIIVGAGIAGLTLALRLQRLGWNRWWSSAPRGFVARAT